MNFFPCEKEQYNAGLACLYTKYSFKERTLLVRWQAKYFYSSKWIV